MSMEPLILAACGLAFLGMAGLSLAMDRHYRQWRPGCPRLKPGQRRLFRYSGWCLLALSAWVSVLAWGVGTGVTAWFGIINGAALILALLLPYQPRLIPHLAAAAGLLALLPIILRLIPTQ